MGLKDKLMAAMEKVTDTIQSDVVPLMDKVKENIQNRNTPLADETERHYYEIVYNLVSCAGGITYEGVRRYVSHHLGQPCDEDILRKALNYLDAPYAPLYLYHRTAEEPFKRALAQRKDFTPEKIDQLIAINKEIDEANRYCCTQMEAYEICYKEIVSDVQTKYQNILDALKNYDRCYHFLDGLDRIRIEYKSKIGENAIETIIHFIVARSYANGNAQTKKFVISKLFNDIVYYCERHPQEKNDYLLALALRALNYEKQMNTSAPYVTVSHQDCRNFVLSDETFNQLINQHPLDREKYIEMYANAIQYADSFMLLSERVSSTFICFNEAVCFAGWKAAAPLYDKGESKRPWDIATVLYSYAIHLHKQFEDDGM